jgi:hypothetical protein
MVWSDIFDFSKKIGYPEIISNISALIALVIATLSFWNSYQTRLLSLPALSVATILEGYDTRAFSEGMLVWYWALNLSNTGGRPLTLLGIGPDDKALPMVVLGKDYQLLNLRPSTRIYVIDSPKFAEIAKGRAAFDQYKPKDLEELSSINLSIPAGESRSLQLAFVVDAPANVADMSLFNVKLNFNTGASYSISKFVRIAAPQRP